MKHLLSIIALTFLVTFASAADNPESVKPAQPVAVPAAPVKHDYGNEFLGFALEKAKLYSDKGEAAISKGVDLAIAESPGVFKEWITWRIWYHALHVAIPLLMITIGVFAFWRFARKHESTRAEHWFGGMIVSGFYIAGSTIFAFCSILVDDPPGTYPREKGHFYSLVQVVTAPRVYVIEQVVDLAKR